jgi:hypothetical protein
MGDSTLIFRTIRHAYLKLFLQFLDGGSLRLLLLGALRLQLLELLLQVSQIALVLADGLCGHPFTPNPVTIQRTEQFECKDETSNMKHARHLKY